MATATPLFGTNTSLTVTGLTTLASDANLLAGWQSGIIEAATVDDMDLQMGFRFVGNTSAPTTAKQIEVWAGACLDGPSGTLFAGGLTGSIGAITLTAVRKAQLQLVRILPTDAVVSGVYNIAAVSMTSVFGGITVPRRFVLFVVHNMGLALSNAAIYYDPVNIESA